MNISKKWVFPDINESDALRISENLGISRLCANVLCARGFGYDEAKNFLSIDQTSFHNPFLLNDMQKAVERINNAIEKKEKIAVYGDYDVDGITSTYILFDYLKTLGADVMYYIPDRIDEGYGMNTGAVDRLHSGNVSLIITVDVGITATNEVEYAKSIGIDVIVTDHHSLKETLPDAVAVINPKIPTASYPFDSLAGVGVAFKLIYAHSGLDNRVFDKYCDIVAIGTIADMVPLKDENRYITTVGIQKLKNTKNIGLQSLFAVAGISMDKISSSDISFAIAPRLNAAGRMSRVGMSVELLLEKDPKTAMDRAWELDNCNKTRQQEEQKIFAEAMEIIEKENLSSDNFIVVAKKGWAHGVIGIVSSKITEKFYKPSAVISINDDGTGKASGRSIKGINLFNVLTNCSQTLQKFGGHELAAGFTVKGGEIETFKASACAVVDPLMTSDITTPTIEIDARINPEDITLDEIYSLSVLEPYGISNRPPLFCMEDMQIESVRYAQNKKHAFLTVSKNGTLKELPAFSVGDTIKNYVTGDYISVVGTLGINSFRGNTQAQFIIRDIKHSELCRRISTQELKMIFADIKNKLTKSQQILKSDDFVAIGGYKKLKACHPKIAVALNIFSELKILDTTESADGYKIFKGENFNGKTSLELSPTYNKYKY